jgi:regulator of RNase E activity RraA
MRCLPQREDVLTPEEQEEAEKQSALWAVFETIEPGDLLVVQAYGDMQTGCLGEMLLSSLQGLGGTGAVVDGCVRDWPEVKKLEIGVWCRGVTPHFASQGRLFPWAYNVPIACSNVLVLPGDIVLADDDGVVVVPATLAEDVLARSLERDDWEAFSRARLREGGALQKYYPLSEEGEAEFQAWNRSQ